MKKRRLLVQLVAVANGAANNAALHVAPPFIGGDHAITHQECSSPNVVGNHAQAFVVRIGAAGFARCRLDQGIKNINLIVAVHMLQDRSQALQAHTRVYTRRGQFDQAAIGSHVKLHEDVVPDFDEAVAIFIRTSWGATGNMGTVVVENF